MSVNIKKNNRILLALNAPVALILGAGSFLGSHIVDKLLSNGIQVIGVDNLNSENRLNLVKASEDKNFHLINSIEDFDLELDRLDYIFIIPQKSQNFKRVFDSFKKFKPRLLLVSSVKLYSEKEREGSLKWLKKTEVDVATIAKDNNLNARILRLGAVFGPRMSFIDNIDNDDPLVKLMYQSLVGDLQKESSLDFSSRALFVMDVVNLIVKCIFAGATAQKIYDGVLEEPVKVSEIRQVLLDPVWYENRNFIPTQLPPWQTPNLEKTINFLNWHPKAKLVESLRITINYFKDNEIEVPKIEEIKSEHEKTAVEGEWKSEKVGDLEGFKAGEVKKEVILEEKKKSKKKIPFSFNKFLTLSFVVLIAYALIWPVFQFGLGVFMFKWQLAEALNHLEKGEFEKSLSSINQAKVGVGEVKEVITYLEPVTKIGLFKNEFESFNSLTNLATDSLDSAKYTILGIQNLFLSLKTVTGELNESPEKYFTSAQSYLASSDQDLSKVFAQINSEDFKKNLPAFLKLEVERLNTKLSMYSSLVNKGRALSALLPEVVGKEGKKEYLILLQNNNELRPTGGFIGSFAKVSFEGGKLKKLEVNDTYAIDGALSIHVEPPKEIKEDLGQKDYFLRDANWEPDFPTSARQIEWFYTKETGERVEGVIALDISAIEDLLSVVGTLDLPDYNEKITTDNLFEKAISYSEVNFFPGTQAKKSFLTALTTSLFNKLFFLPNQNWPGIVKSLGRSLEEKHMSIYLDNPKLFSFVLSQNWGGILPRGSNNEKNIDFLALVEANLGANKANYYLDRSYNLDTLIGRDGDVGHRLRISYTNRSPSDAFPAGKYKNRMRIYLPTGTKLNRVLWGEHEITNDVSSFTEYGRTGYSFLITLLPKEQKTLVLDYQTPVRLDFVDKKASYRLDVIKQASIGKDPFIWNMTYPINLRIASEKDQKFAPQQYSIKTDLSTDKTFKLEFIK